MTVKKTSVTAAAIVLVGLLSGWTMVVVVPGVEASTATRPVAIDTSSSTIMEDCTTTTTTTTTCPFHNHTTTTTTTDDILLLEEPPFQALLPLTFEGIDLPGYHHHCRHSTDGRLLSRQGYGLRRYTFGGFSLKMYVAALYTTTTTDDALDIMVVASTTSSTADTTTSSSMPSGGGVLEFTFLRSVDQSKVRWAWQKQLEWSITHHYDGLNDDIAAFVKLFGPMARGGSITVQLSKDSTVIWENQDHHSLPVGSIAGPDFSRAFWSMWFGDRPVQEDLKDALLGITTS